MTHPSPLLKAQAAREIIRRDSLRKSRRFTTLIVAIVAIAVAGVYFGYHPERAHSQTSFAPLLASYNHVAECRTTLRGGAGSDDDVHALGVATFAQYFVGFGSYWHGSDGSAYVIGRLMYSFGWIDWTGHCWNGDYHQDSMR